MAAAQKPGVYEIYQKGMKRKALIINVLKNRPGAVADTPALKSFLELVGFEVEVVKDVDQTRKGIRVAIENFRTSLQDVSCILVSVMSHGQKSVYFDTTDKNKKMNFVKDVVAQFNNKNCPEMKDKPKIFLANFCRCHYKSNQDCDSTETGLVDAKDFLLKRKKIEAEGWGTYSDLYVCFATSDDFLAFRDDKNGAWFIQSFCTIGTANAIGTMDFKDIMALVFTHVNEVQGDPTCRQCPTYHDTGFVNKLYLRQNFNSSIQLSNLWPSTLSGAEAVPIIIPGVSNPTEVGVQEVAKLLAEQPLIIRDIQAFVSLLPGVKLTDVQQDINLSNVNLQSWNTTFVKILQFWKSSNAAEATIPNLIRHCGRNEKYTDLIGNLQKQSWKDAMVVYD